MRIGRKNILELNYYYFYYFIVKIKIFFADKLLTLTDAHPLIVYLLGICYFHNQDYKKVHNY